jgi:hypothetical protein
VQAEHLADTGYLVRIADADDINPDDTVVPLGESKRIGFDFILGKGRGVIADYPDRG